MIVLAENKLLIRTLFLKLILHKINFCLKKTLYLLCLANNCFLSIFSTDLYINIVLEFLFIQGAVKINGYFTLQLD